MSVSREMLSDESEDSRLLTSLLILLLKTVSAFDSEVSRQHFVSLSLSPPIRMKKNKPSFVGACSFIATLLSCLNVDLSNYSIVHDMCCSVHQHVGSNCRVVVSILAYYY